MARKPDGVGRGPTAQLALFQEPNAGLEGGQEGQDGQCVCDSCNTCDSYDTLVRSQSGRPKRNGRSGAPRDPGAPPGLQPRVVRPNMPGGAGRWQRPAPWTPGGCWD